MKCREYGATLVQIDTAQENNGILKNFPKGTVEKKYIFLLYIERSVYFLPNDKKKYSFCFLRKCMKLLQTQYI